MKNTCRNHLIFGGSGPGMTDIVCCRATASCRLGLRPEPPAVEPSTALDPTASSAFKTITAATN